jgi:26S proteasome regulatory subunit N3
LTEAIQSALTGLKGENREEDQISSGLVEGSLIERNAYVLLLISVYLLDSKQLQVSMEASTLAVMLLQGSEDHFNTFDPLLSRNYYFLARAYELAGNLPALHNFLMVGLRTASLRHDKETLATVYNCILRLHLLQNDYETAGIFLKNSPFPTGSTNLNNQTARYHFYRARISSVFGNYLEAAEDLNQTLRKVPHGHFALNFILSATKFLIVVQLLCGEIPDRSTFDLHSRALEPYLELTQSVRLGELAHFQQVVNRHMGVWTLDGTKILVERLHESVLRVGLRRLSQAYVKISFSDISKKLGLPTEQDALLLVKKALSEGLISAQINETLNCLESQQLSDLYTTRAPQDAFTSRTQALQNFHNEAVRAMRFPEKVPGSSSAKIDEERRPTDEELMDEFMDADEDMF